ncbi:MAG: hypothetical protein R3C61_06620 [Bacteroidia bacterium]
MPALRVLEGTPQAALSQEVVNTSNTVTKTSDYVGAFHYEDFNLMFLQMEEGRVRLDGSDWVYEYQIKVEDPSNGKHLGNVRVTFGDLNDDGILDPNTEIQEGANQNVAPFIQVSGDGRKAKAANMTVYSFDEQHVDKHIINPSTVSGVESRDNIATTKDLYDNKFSILRDALKTASGQK